MKHFLQETDIARDRADSLFERCAELKAERMTTKYRPLEGQSWGMLFFKNSTRTRVSFEVGIRELGGHPVILSADQMQLSRGESCADTARVLSRYLHGLVIRCFGHDTLLEFSRYGDIPVVNALSDLLHPCQIYSDLFTLAERWGSRGSLAASLQGKKLAFLGDTACNMASSWLLGGAYFGMDIHLAGPARFAPQASIRDLLRAQGLDGKLKFTSDPQEAVADADVVYTDVWVSMGAEDNAAERLKEMAPYAVTEDLMSAARPKALFMHCLPAHPGQEVSREVLEGPGSIVFDQAENRLHMHKAILVRLLDGAADPDGDG